MAIGSNTARIAIIIASGCFTLAISRAIGEAVLPQFGRALQHGDMRIVAEIIAAYGIFFMLVYSVLVQDVANLGFHRRLRMIGTEPADSGLLSAAIATFLPVTNGEGCQLPRKLCTASKSTGGETRKRTALA